MVRARKSFVLGYTANGWQTQSSDLLLDDVRTNACDQRNETRAYGFQVTRQRLSFSRISTISRLSYSRRFCFSTSASDPNIEKGVLMLDCQGLSIPRPPSSAWPQIFLRFAGTMNLTLQPRTSDQLNNNSFLFVVSSIPHSTCFLWHFFNDASKKLKWKV